MARLEKSGQSCASLIFYMPPPSGVVIVRVLHGPRDWWSLLGLSD